MGPPKATSLVTGQTAPAQVSTVLRPVDHYVELPGAGHHTLEVVMQYEAQGIGILRCKSSKLETIDLGALVN